MAFARSFVAIAAIVPIILTACGGGGGGGEQGATNQPPAAVTPSPVPPPSNPQPPATPPVTPPVQPPVTPPVEPPATPPVDPQPPSPPPPGAYGYGDKHIVVVHVKFADTGVDPYPVSQTIARTERVKAFFKEISYGKSTQTYDVKPWLTLPESKRYYGEKDQLGMGLALDASQLAADKYDLRQTDILMLVMTPLELGYPGCIAYRASLVTQAVRKELSIVILSGNDMSCSNADLMSHELMHAYGLPSEPTPLHTSLFTCRTWQHGLPASFTDPTQNDAPCEDWSADAVFYPYAAGDVLGGYRGHPNVFWKQLFGWLATEQVFDLSRGGVARLDPYEAASGGLKGARIDLGQDQAGKPAAYWLEYRTESSRSLEEGTNLAEWGWQHGRVRVWLNLDSVPGAAIQGGKSYIQQSRIFSFLTAPYGLSEQVDLDVGNTFHDPHRGIKVSRTTNVGNQATVSVVVSPLAISDPIGVIVPTGSLRTVTVTNTGTTNVTQSALVLKGRTPTAFRLSADSCGNTTLKPGSTCSFAVSHVSEAGNTVSQFAHVEWTTNDLVRSRPTVGLVGTP